MNIVDAIRKLVEGDSLTREEANEVMDQVMSGDATPAQVAAFITALRMKGETVPEIAGCAEVMREKATPIPLDRHDLVDTCGTGGDGSHTINVSTAAALIAAGAGIPIAKHGNRSVSSRCGSADVLKELGVNIEAVPEVVGRCIEQAGVGFFFAPAWHGAMKHAIGPRREIGIRTVFNILGPLCNPARVRRQVVGVYDPDLLEVVAGVLQELGSEHVWVVHGSDGLDEITVTGPTHVAELKDGMIRRFDVRPLDVGIQERNPEDLKGGEPAECAKIILDILQGWKGATRDICVINAAAAIVVGGKAEDLGEGVKLARDSIDTGKALEVLEKLVRVSKAE